MDRSNTSPASWLGGRPTKASSRFALDNWRRTRFERGENFQIQSSRTRRAIAAGPKEEDLHYYYCSRLCYCARVVLGRPDDELGGRCMSASARKSSPTRLEIRTPRVGGAANTSH